MSVDLVRAYWLDGDGFERAVRFVHPRKQVPAQLRSFVDAARAMRGGDGGRKPWRHAIVPVTLCVPRGERRGRGFEVRGVMHTSLVAYASELHGEIEAR